MSDKEKPTGGREQSNSEKNDLETKKQAELGLTADITPQQQAAILNNPLPVVNLVPNEPKALDSLPPSKPVAPMESRAPNRRYHRLGYIKDAKDTRDLPFKLTKAECEALKNLPQSIDLRTTGHLPGVYDQGDLGSCFPAGTPILMADGTERPIEEVAVGNRVISHTSKARKVTNVFRRNYSGLTYTIKVKGYNSPLTMTDEHPVAVVPNVSRRAQYGEFSAGELIWQKANELKPGDFVLLPHANSTRDNTEPLYLDVVSFIEHDVVDDKDNGTVRLAEASGNNQINRYFKLDEKTAQLIGLFLAEGSLRKSASGYPNGLQFTFARHEETYQAFVKETLEEIFGVKAYIQKLKGRDSISDVRCDNSTLANVFLKLCGEYSLKKYVNPLFFQSPKSVRLALLKGWLMGDGTQKPVITSNYKGQSYKAVAIHGVTSSENLYRGFFRLALSAGLKPSANIRKQSAHQNVEGRVLSFYSRDVLTVFPEHTAQVEEAGIRSDGSTLWKQHELGYLCRISKIEIEEVEDLAVFNFEVEEDNTYIANSIAVHNCVAQAAAALLYYLDQHFPDSDPYPEVQRSRLQLYYNARKLEDNVANDDGCMIRDAFKGLNTLGVAPESAWPYEPNRFSIEPPETVTRANEKLLYYKRVARGVQSIKLALAAGYPVVVGLTLYDSFEGDQATNTGLVPMPNKRKEQELGGHAVLIVGYDDAKNYFVVRNSWGVSWGDHGYFYLPYEYIKSSYMASDFWTATRF
jgi:C1A family cysteine protease